MFRMILGGIFLYKLTLVLAKEANLPLCPTNVLYFPQNLPMHCRMPTNADFAGGPAPAPTVPPFYQSLPPDKQPLPIPMPVPGIPGMPIPGPMPGPMALPGGPMPFPGPMPMPLPGGPAHKLPVIVMPFYSPDPSFKKTERPNLPLPPMRPRKPRRRHRRRRPFFPPSLDSSSSTDTDTSSDTSSSSSEYSGWWRGRKSGRKFNVNKKKKKHHQKRQLLTPVLQYVTKDGYVIFEKKISKNEAKDWLTVNRDGVLETTTRTAAELEVLDSNEPNGIQSKEKESVTDDNAEVMTKRNHRQKVYKSIKANKNKIVRKKFVKQ